MSDTPQTALPDPLAAPNIRMLSGYQICFAARFYYPVFLIMFLDFGLTLEQFGILNAVWAAAIVICEVPSGALADLIGRRNLLVVGAILMVLEMAVLCFVPLGSTTLVFWAFCLNRILSGMAEAAMTGADEALAYDSLKRHGTEGAWARVLEVLTRRRSLGFVFALGLGALVYDAATLNRIGEAVGLNPGFSQQTTFRFPLYLNLVTACLAVVFALRLREVSDGESTTTVGLCERVRSTVKQILGAGRWLVTTRFASVLLAVSLTFDGVILVSITLNSEYYRLIEIPEAAFGLLGIANAAIAIFLPRLCRQLAEKHTPVFNLAFIAVLAFVGLLGLSLFLPWIGWVFMAMVFAVLHVEAFLQSHYLNRITASAQRATVLSFRSLAGRLSYGVFGLLYTVLLANLRGRLPAAEASGSGTVFEAALAWFPWAFAVAFVGLTVFAAIRLRRTGEAFRRG